MDSEIIRIMTPDFELRGEIPVYSSLQFTRSHYGVGGFELHLHPGAPNVAQLTHDSIIYLASDPRKAGIIEGVELKEGSDLVITGHQLKGLAKRRISVPPVVGGSFGWDRIIDDTETVFKHYAAVNMTAPVNPDRTMPRVTLAPNQHRGLAGLPWQTRFEDLDEVFRQIGEYADMGWDIVPDFDGQTFRFDVIPGRDLAEGNPGMTRVTISVEMGNAADASYLQNHAAWRTVAYAGGAGEDEGRLILSVGEEAGLSRREMWVDAGSIDNAPDLIAMGQRKLAEAGAQEIIKAPVIDSGAFRYGRDWDVGDRVTVRAGNAQMDARIIEVREALEQGRIRQLTVTFGTAPITLTSTIRSLQNNIVR